MSCCWSFIFNFKKNYSDRMKSSKYREQKNILIAIAIVIVDQMSKYLISRSLPYYKGYELIPNLIQIRVVRNTGAAFSLLDNQTFFLGLISLIVSIYLCWLVINKYYTLTLKNIGISFLLGGSLGNGIDRWINGYVIDFIELISIKFPIFNIADISINIAILIFIIDYIRSKE